MNRIGQSLLTLLLICIFLATGAAHAQPDKGDRGRGRGNDAAERGRGGPPPWAPAHGYRREDLRKYGLAAVPIDLGAGRCNREVMGQVLGAAAGGYIGSRIGDNSTERLIGVAAGAVVGMVIGGEIGRSLDRADKLCVDQALEQAPDGSRIVWNDGDRQYAVTPKNTFQSRDGRSCREYQMVAEVGGRDQQVTGTACRQEDGSWQLNP